MTQSRRGDAVALCLALSLAVVLASPKVSAAGGSGDTDTGTMRSASRDANYVRAGFEELAIFGLGMLQYAATTSNSSDWDLGYDWPSFRSKLTGESSRFDTNRYDTNMITHPIAGYLYYSAARGNRLGAGESFLIAVAMSTAWEFVGELRERVSVNDLIVTPLSGAALSEGLSQIGTFFRRSKGSIATDILSGVFAPFATAHDLVDHATVERDSTVDFLGLTRRIGHRFDLRLGGGMIDGDPTRGLDGRFAVAATILDIDGYASPGRVAAFETEPLMSRVAIEGAIGRSGLRDLQLDVVVAPFGFHAHDLRRERGRVLGERVLVGATAGFDYALHDYSSPPFPGTDRVGGVHLGGLVASYEHAGPHFRARTSFAARPAFAAVRSFALDEFLARGGESSSTPSVAVEQGYYFALGAVVSPSVELGFDGWAVGAEARLETYAGIEGLDRNREAMQREAKLSDRRTLGRLHLSYSPVEALEFRVTAERRLRSGTVDDATVSRSEAAWITSAGLAF